MAVLAYALADSSSPAPRAVPAPDPAK